MDFIFVTDQHPLTDLCGHKSGVSALVAGQLQEHVTSEARALPLLLSPP